MRSAPARMPRVFVITGPSGVGKGTLIRAAARARARARAVASRRPRARRGRARRDGVDYHFLSDEEFDAPRRRRATSSSTPTYSGRRYGTLRSELERRARRGRPVVLEIEVQGARQVREAMPEAVQIFIAPPVREALRDAAGRPRHRRPRAGRAPPADAAARSSPPQGEFAHVVVNDRLEDAVEELVARLVPRSSREPRGTGLRTAVISPRIDKLLEQRRLELRVASSSLPSARGRSTRYYHNLGEGTFDEFPPPMVETGSKNYLTIALEEVAAGKIKYQLPLGASGPRGTLLLGVSGGIAAYKALELVRLATKAGHAVRVVQTPTAAAVRRRGPRSRRSPAPRCSTDEFERDPARGAFPGPGSAGRTTRSATSSWSATPTPS